ncbi:MAG: hypothetical protein A2636_01960 [Elusimicrobia bacterium RIFCSPHIGHO2_01_FULL_64_10]|nr:MAG: hypothetical protein A2636_01960 [Elusimicrobia bacterium RIFCSPHIGHO2_01_FULL_64_10]
MNPLSLTDFERGPVVRLANAFRDPYDNAVAAARTCYSSEVVSSDDVRKDEAARARRDAIAKSIYLAGHHTTLQHASFQFAIERVSRNCIWSFLHSHPYYNSEQVSQRYVRVAPENFSVPVLPESCRGVYFEAVEGLMRAYQTLQEVLEPVVRSEHGKIFPARDVSQKRWKSWIQKRCQEVARYVLPLATHAHLYHTISGVTLLRYLRLCRTFDVPREQEILVRKMAEAVREWDPDFLKNAEDPLPIEETPEYAFFPGGMGAEGRESAVKFLKEFDGSLGGRTSLLVDHKPNSEKVMAGAVRNMLALPAGELDDARAVALVMDPARNPLLSETMNLTHHSKLTRAMVHPHFTFRKKISHTADSQGQRHRTVPGSRPVLARHAADSPDYVTPDLIRRSPRAEEVYVSAMNDLWGRIVRLREQGADPEAALYLLPNAFPIRFEESGSLLDFHHKWVHRLCYTAQEEIWNCCVEEVSQVEEVFPDIGRHLRAPCALRRTAGRKPFCPEGDRFCGVPVWNLNLEQYRRTL